MKTLYTFFFILFCFSMVSHAQAPPAIPYQAVARAIDGSLISNQTISLRFSIRDSIASGAIIYQETQTATTNSLGLFTANIGMGIPVSGTFTAIDWAANAKFMQVEMDAAGGIVYINMGIQQILSVPYSIYAKTSGSSTSVSGTTNFVSRFTGSNTVGSSIIFDNGTNIGIGNSSPASLFSVGSMSQFQINSSGAIGAATGIISSGTIQFSGLSVNGIVRTSGGIGVLSSSGGGINLATEVTGILSVANGGTGSSSLNYIDLSSNQFVGGRKTFTNIPSGTSIGDGTIYINPANNGGSASNTLIGLAVAGIEKFRVDASGNIKTTSLEGIGTRMVQTDPNGVLIPLPSGTASQVLLGTGVWGNIPTTTVWSLTGNAGTVAGTNFLGTTDSQPLMFKVNNQKAGYVDSVSKVSAFGYQSLNISTGENNTAIGFEALKSNTTADFNTAVGSTSLQSNIDGTENTAIGIAALRQNYTGLGNTATGSWALLVNNGSHNTAVGGYALSFNTSGNENTAIGYNANIGAFAINNATAIGANATVSQSNSLVLGNNANVGIGTSTPAFMLDVSDDASINDVRVGKGSGDFIDNTALGNFVLFQNSNGTGNTGIGYRALRLNFTGSNNTATGVNALHNNGIGNNNTSMGFESLMQNNGNDNTAVGHYALRSNIDGHGNTAIGLGSLKDNTSGHNNVAMGINALFSNFSGIENIAIGKSALNNNFAGNFNIAIGNSALGNNTGGSFNTAIGSGADIFSPVPISNATAIGAGAIVSQSNSLVLGNLADVGIGTSSPSAKLDVIGDVRVSSTITSGALNFPGIVTNNTAGLLGTTSTIPVAYGGTGTSSTLNPGSVVFAGTGGVYSEDAGLFFNQSQTRLGIGTNFPEYNLDVNGDIRGGEHFIFNANNAAINIGPFAKLFFRKNAIQGNPNFYTDLAVLTDAGDFGIGISTPLEKLHVIGNGLFTGNLNAFKGSFTGDLTANNGVFLGNVTAACGVLVCSDVRYKKTITPLSGSLEKLCLLNGVNYYFKKNEFPELNFNDDKQIGLIAQEVEIIFPELVRTDGKGYKSVDYAKLTPILVEAIKELKAENDKLKKESLSAKKELDVYQSQTQEKLFDLEAKINLLMGEQVTENKK